MAKLDFRNKWVLVTGASSGLGKEMALYLAKHEKANVIVAARRKDRLETLKQQIEKETDSQVKVLEADVSTTESTDKLFEDVVKMADIYGVINNAGITFYGPATTNDLEFFDKIVDVNLKAVIRLSLKFLEYFKEKGAGALMNVTSEAGFIPLPYQNVYSASKHAAQAFTQSLYMENLKSDITICSYAPGGIATEMLTTSGLDKKHSPDSSVNMRADVAARLGIRTFKKKKFVCVPGFINQLTVFLTRFVPRKWLGRISEIIYRPPANE